MILFIDEPSRSHRSARIHSGLATGVPVHPRTGAHAVCNHRGRRARAARPVRRKSAPARCRRARRRWASTPARERRFDPSSADRSAQGQQRIANQLRADLERANAFDTSGLSHATRTSFEVVRSAYATALEGFALPYGDVPVGGWRNTPYVVIQNVGAYLDIPRFLDSDHRIENAADAEAYLARLQSYAKQLDGELGRMQAARAAGSCRPAFLIDKALAQMSLSAKNAREGGTLVESIERRTKNIPGELGRARAGDRRAGGRARARAADSRTAGAASRGNQRRRHVGAAARRRVLPVGAQGVDHHHHVARRGPRDGPKRAGAPACADGRDPEGDRLLAGYGRRTDEGAGEGSPLSVPRRRQGPRRDHGVHPESPRLDPMRRCRARSTRSSIRTWK